MEIIILIAVMILVGLLMGWVAGFIWKDNRPIGVRGDYIASIITTVVVGLLDWFVIPAMGFSDTLKFLGTALEPPLSALLVLWVIRKANS
jgi:uncharacterized membrane protein YeaQ/YmgE (transglycosylase-associated protein family)